jgi:hypothetical protein
MTFQNEAQRVAAAGLDERSLRDGENSIENKSNAHKNQAASQQRPIDFAAINRAALANLPAMPGSS